MKTSWQVYPVSITTHHLTIFNTLGTESGSIIIARLILSSRVYVPTIPRKSKAVLGPETPSERYRAN